MALTFDSLQNDNVKFLQGTQADLNKYFLKSGDTAKSGKAIEGAFYLTTDTHRLYVGRKITTGDTTADVGKIVPVQVSAGITTVADVGVLTDISTATAQEGDFYYIENQNILAILRINDNNVKEWVQVNKPTGITELYDDTVAVVGQNAVELQTYINTQAGRIDPASLKITGGRNVTISSIARHETTPDSGVYVNPELVIDGVDYTLGTTASTVDQGTILNGATIKLDSTTGSSTGTTTTDSSVTIAGATDSIQNVLGSNTIKATSNASGSILLQGPRFNQMRTVALSEQFVAEDANEVSSSNFEDYYVLSNGNYVPATGSYNSNTTYYKKQGGFSFALDYYDPLRNDNLTTATTDSGGALLNGVGIDPIIQVGSTNNTLEQVHFNNGLAALNVYTKAEVDRALAASAITAAASANAMVYRGTFSTLDNLYSQFATKSGNTWTTTTARVGDTYKAVFTESYALVDSSLVNANNYTNFYIYQSGSQTYRQATSSDTYNSNTNYYRLQSPNATVLTLDGQEVHNGDLVILNGTPGYRVTSQTVTADNFNQFFVYNQSTATYSHATEYNAGTTYYEYGIIPWGNLQYDVIPSGDEPNLYLRNAGENVYPDHGFGITAGGERTPNQQTTIITLADSNLTGIGDILTTTYTGDSRIYIGSTYDAAKHRFDLQFEHATTGNNSRTYTGLTPGDGTHSLTTTTYPLPQNSGFSLLGDGTYQLFLLSNATDIKVDSTGHVLGVEGTKIAFRHNRLSEVKSDYVTNVGAHSGSLQLTMVDEINTQKLATLNVASDTLHFSTITQTVDDETTAVGLKFDLLWENF